MDTKQRAIVEVVDKVLLADKELLNSDVAVLSDLNDEGLASFRNKWKKAEPKQRLALISKMVSLSEEDFILDFTRIFKVGIEDTEEDIRIKGLEGLELEDKYIYARPVLNILKSDESPEVRSVAARVLGKFALMAECGDMPEAIGLEISTALIETLEDMREPLSVRRRALEAVAPCRQELVEHYIEDYYYSDDPKVKASAIFAMGLNCNDRWLRFLADEMQSETSEFRYEAARAAGEIGDEEAVPHLIKLVDDNDPEVQDAAIGALGKIGGKEAKQTLQKLGKSSNARVKGAAQAALTELLACEDPLSLSF
jgi:HEAT repeat protein